MPCAAYRAAMSECSTGIGVCRSAPIPCIRHDHEQRPTRSRRHIGRSRSHCAPAARAQRRPLGSRSAAAPADPFGPRIPMMIFSPFCEGRGIDHTQYETVSILAFIEKNWGLPLSPTATHTPTLSPVHSTQRTEGHSCAPRSVRRNGQRRHNARVGRSHRHAHGANRMASILNAMLPAPLHRDRSLGHRSRRKSDRRPEAGVPRSSCTAERHTHRGASRMRSPP